MGLFRKLLRRTFYTAAALSTLLLVATLILWPVSYHRLVRAAHSVPNEAGESLGVDSGRVFLGFSRGFRTKRTGLSIESEATTPAQVIHWSYLTWNESGPDELQWYFDMTLAGVSWDYLSDARGSYAILKIPCSYLALLFSILPLLAFRSIRQRRKLSRVGRCAKCGYDLRAHAAGGRCPECGTPIAP